MVKRIKNVRELEQLLMFQWYNRERRLWNWMIRNRSPYNKIRFLRCMVRRLQKKGVILTPEVLEEIFKHVFKY